MRVGNGRVTKQMLDEWVQEFFKFCEDGPLLTYSYHLYICKRPWHVTGVQDRCSQCVVGRQNGLEGSGQERLKAVLVICEEGGGQLRAWTKAVPLFCTFSTTLLWASFICCGSVTSIWSTERRLEQILRKSSAPDPFSSRTPTNTVKPSSSKYLDRAWPNPESPPARG